MPNELPTFQELLSAQQAARGQGPAQAALTGINQGAELGRSILEKQQEHEQKKKEFALKVQQALTEQKTAEAGIIPADQSLTGAPASAAVQTSMTKTPKEPGNVVKLAENDEGVLTYDPATRKTKMIPFKGKTKTGGQSGPAETLSQASSMLDDLEQVLKKVPSGGKGFIQEALSSNLAGRGALAIPEARLYNQMVPGAGVAIYRAVTRDTRLSDADAASRARPLLAYEGESEQVRNLKLQFLKKLMTDQQAAIAKGKPATTIEQALMDQHRFLGEQSNATQPSGGTNFASLDEAEKANLPKGTKITVGGRPAVVE